MIFQETVSELLTSRSLMTRQADRIFSDLFRSRLSTAQAKALLLLLAKKGEDAAEVLGCLRALRRLEPAKKTGIRDLLDTCGTGGDQSHSMNISTLTAIILAGAGCRVAKHGNRALSSNCGSSDLMDALGVRLDAPPQNMIRAIKECGIGYFHAPLYHPVFARVQPLRRELKTRTLFNLLGPLVNPLQVDYQIIGVSKPHYVKLFAEVLQKTTIRRAMIFHSTDGMDEISTSALSLYALVERDKIRMGEINPKRLHLKPMKLSECAGGDVNRNRELAMGILSGRVHTSLRDLILINCAAGLYTTRVASSLETGIQAAADSIDSGRALYALERLKRISYWS